MKLYYVPMTRALRPRWLLEELEIPYDLVRLDPSKGENRTPAYLALNPTGHVPTLVDGGSVLYESAAMMLYLPDRFPDKGLAPPIANTADRAAYLKWIVYAVSEIEPGVHLQFQHGLRLPEEKRVPAIAAWGRERALAALAPVRATLAGREFLVGDRFTAADVLMASLLGWARMLGIVDDPELVAYVKRHMARPAAKRAHAD